MAARQGKGYGPARCIVSVRRLIARWLTRRLGIAQSVSPAVPARAGVFAFSAAGFDDRAGPEQRARQHLTVEVDLCGEPVERSTAERRVVHWHSLRSSRILFRSRVLATARRSMKQPIVVMSMGGYHGVGVRMPAPERPLGTPSLAHVGPGARETLDRMRAAPGERHRNHSAPAAALQDQDGGPGGRESRRDRRSTHAGADDGDVR